MPECDSEKPVYYDGSMHPAELSSLSSDQKAANEPAANEEWRHYIGANPYGAEGK